MIDKETKRTWKSAGGKILTLWCVGPAPIQVTPGRNKYGEEHPSAFAEASRTSACTIEGWCANTSWWNTKAEALSEKNAAVNSDLAVWPVELLYIGGAAQAAAVGVDLIRWHTGAAKSTALTEKWAGWARRDRGRMGWIAKECPWVVSEITKMMLDSLDNAYVFAPDPEC